MKINNAVIILKALFEGYEVESEHYKICMSEDNKICALYAIVDENNTITGDIKLCPLDWSMNGFIAFCEKMPEEEIIGLIGSMALTKFKKTDRKLKAVELQEIGYDASGANREIKLTTSHGNTFE